ncbi:MAG: hypothetical protein NTX87_06975 [Planctomycetota bacterium]|nr:hypothetical protein [Planctomycetota bacterium]
MDKALLELMDSCAARESTIRVTDAQKGEIEVETPDGPRRHILKPLPELFGQGHGIMPTDPTDEQFLPLLMCIETSIVSHYETDPRLTDSHVRLILSRLATKPGCDPGDDELCRRIQVNLRIFLSLDDYSRQEVRWALHKIERSVRLHSSLDGPQGYLDFISGMLGGR